MIYITLSGILAMSFDEPSHVYHKPHYQHASPHYQRILLVHLRLKIVPIGNEKHLHLNG